MGRSNLCIFCGAPATSKEHLLPACLGGKVERRGILCKPCNNKGGRLDAVLEERLRPFNVMLDVRSSRDPAPKFAPVRPTDDGVPLLVDPLGNVFEPTKVTESVRDGVWSAQVSASSEREFQRVLAVLRKKHPKRLGLTGRTVTRRRLLGPVNMDFSFGGPDCVRAVGRIVLSFLAHLDYEVAAKDNLSDFKDWLYSPSHQAHSWAAFSSFPTVDATTMPEEFNEHRILLWQDRGRILSWVSLFGVFALDFALGTTAHTFPPRDIRVRLGEGDPAKCVSVTTMSQAPPDVHCLSGRAPNMDQIKQRMTSFARHATVLQEKHRNSEVLARVHDAASGQQRHPIDRVCDALESEDQGILITVVEAIQMLDRTLTQSSIDSPGLRELLQILTTHEDSNDRTLRPLTECLSQLVRRTMALELLAILGVRPLSSEDIQDVLRGPTATRLSLRAVSHLLAISDARWAVLGDLRYGRTRSEEMA